MRRLHTAGALLALAAGLSTIGACSSSPDAAEPLATSSAAVSIGGWSGVWWDAGGTTFSDPSLVGPSTIAGTPYLFTTFVVGLGSSVYYNGFGMAGIVPMWFGWKSLGGTVYGNPSAVTGGSGSAAYTAVFVRGLGNSLYFQAATNGGDFGGWQPLGGTLTGDPVAVQAGPWVYVFVPGIGNSVYYRRVFYTQVGNPNAYSPYVDLGDGTAFPLGVAAQANGNVDVVITSTAGNAVHQIEYNYATDSWGGWNNLGGVAATGAAVVSPYSGRVDLVVGGYANFAWHKGGDGKSFGDWQQVPASPIYFAPFATNPPSQLSIAAPTASTLEFVVQGQDLYTYHQEFDGTSWSGWNRFGGCEAPIGKVALLKTGNDSLVAAVRGIDQAVYAGTFSSNPAAGSANAPPACGCGNPGQPCCGVGGGGGCGSFSFCQAEGNWTDTVCVACGYRGEACCPGTGCVNQDVCSGGTCVPPPCGALGEACCTVPGQPVCPQALYADCINHRCVLPPPPPPPTPPPPPPPGTRTCSGRAALPNARYYIEGTRDAALCAMALSTGAYAKAYFANSSSEAQSCALDEFGGTTAVTNPSPQAAYVWDYGPFSEPTTCQLDYVVVLNAADADSCEKADFQGINYQPDPTGASCP